MDLNLVRVFVAIHETRSLTLAAERLFVTQSAVSQSLARLRRQFDDPLFERQGREMVPTPVADRAYPGFKDALVGIDRTLDEVQDFDVAASERTFRIALSELGEIGWLPALFAAVHRRAPRVRIEIVSLVVSSLAEWLSRGTVDLAVTPERLSGEFERTVVKTQGYSVVMSAHNPLAGRPLTLEEYADGAHVDVTSDSGAHLLHSARQEAGLSIAPFVVLQHMAAVPQLLSSSDDLVATVPESIALGWAANWPLATHPLPFDMAPVELSLYRRQTSQQLAALDWIYETVARALGATPGEFSAIHASSS